MTHPASPSAPGLVNWALLSLLGLIWGASFLGAKLALISFEPLTIAAARIALGAALLLVITYAAGHRLPDTKTSQGRRIWLHCFGMAIFTNALPFSLLNWGQQWVSSGFAGITMAVVPLLVLPLAHVFVPGEQMTTRRIVGFLIGFVGVVVLIGPAALGAGDSFLLPRLACVGAACCYATGSIITRRSPAVSVMSFSAGGLLLATVMIVPIALWSEGLPSLSPEPQALAGVLFLGVFPTALATLLLVRIIQSAGPGFMSLVNYQVPVWAVVLGVVILSEALPGQFLAALALILLGLAISQWKRSQKSA